MTDNQRKSAVALKYDQAAASSPKVIAKGMGATAEEIIESARQNQVQIQEDASLVQLLSKLEINQEIPPDLYQAVAEVFAFIYQLDQASEPKG
ncbi:EscU/YscU/HrcU family type III secretion system export apparatus switch protein [Pseudalkalibacillus salsuginis]|uniref:EscU/YscU/HrcU family type III secretion system export apparatus switch protein n=1 Tax=Pseudalkalibacillus salsuginis TaxID=2910972 RepID=UPI001F3373B4|nr:EscU/YscU/HrcU family type III secretion system export apparatus switch protein [Pseudalkalibacillus salsuginis]MCF6410550.1 EscU/YscU/HrcU family type III secretion system export apparatus switch protein [Pseudalkalibacillus salsuginis]